MFQTWIPNPLIKKELFSFLADKINLYIGHVTFVSLKIKLIFKNFESQLELFTLLSKSLCAHSATYILFNK
jgi:hypothetical protein